MLLKATLLVVALLCSTTHGGQIQGSCGVNVQFSNGYIDPPSGQVELGQSLYFFCENGYTLIGPSSVTCKLGGYGLSGPPRCQPQSSGGATSGGIITISGSCSVSAPANGYVTPSSGTVPLGKSVRFSCNSGYRRNGKVSLRCFSYGFNGIPPQCTKIPTKNPKMTCTARRPLNGRVIPGSGVATLAGYVNYKCNAGYKMQGQSKSICTKNGFVPLPPTCLRVKKCPVCKRDPCSYKTCPKYPDAVCHRQSCSCSAYFVEKTTIYSESDCSVNDPPKPCPRCVERFCSGWKTCPRHPDAKCMIRHCTCFYNFVGGGNVYSLSQCGLSGTAPGPTIILPTSGPPRTPGPPKFPSCPPCKGNACSGQTCAKYPGTVCYVMPCTCKPVFVIHSVYYSQDDCIVRVPPPPIACADCAFSGKSLCPAVPGAKMIYKFCACSFDFMHANRILSDQECNNGVVIPPQPPGCATCAMQVCYPGRTCAKYPNAVCHEQDCNCSPWWVLGTTIYSNADCAIDAPPRGCPRCSGGDTCYDRLCFDHEGTSCMSRHCSCGTFFVGRGKVHSLEQCGVPKTIKPVPPHPSCRQCRALLCYPGKTCQKYPDAVCYAMPCSCQAVFLTHSSYYTEEDCIVHDPPKPIICAGCAAGYLEGLSCPGVPGAKRIFKFCECSAIFVHGGRILADFECQEQPPACPVCQTILPICHPGQTCARFPNAKCHTQECSCSPVFVTNSEYFTLEDCALPAPDPEPCAGCSPNPCGDQKRCPSYPGAMCVSRYCGCDSAFVFKGAMLTDEQCNNCPSDSPQVECFANPCQFARCPNFPEAECRANYCGGCNYDFFLDGHKVKCSEGKCPYLPTTSPCNKECNGDLECPGERLCCDNGCNSKCMEPVPVPPTCPTGFPQATCNPHPCDGAICAGNQNAVCQGNFCDGCYADFYLNGVMLPHEQCEAPRCRRLCPPGTCADYKCRGYPGATCKVESCACSPRFYDKKGFRLTPTQCNKCPSGQTQYNCAVDPCAGKTCPGHPSAVCVANYCGGCNYDFYVDGSKVKCGRATCPSGFPQATCNPHPCNGATCAGEPTAVCQGNFCDGCYADFYLNGVMLPHEQCEAPTCRKFCPRGTCADYKCRGYPGATCNVETCACTPRFYDNKGFRLTPSQCNKCPHGQTQHNCAVDPCAGRTCPAAPNAVCVSNYCGGCTYEFYADGNKIDNCDANLPRCQIYAGYVAPSRIGVCKAPICFSHDHCKTGYHCCNNGCTNVCIRNILG